MLTIKFRCGCKLQLKDKQVFLTLAKTPAPGCGNRTRLLGYIHANVMNIFRNGRDFLRVRDCYGINRHLLESASMLGFGQVYCITPVRGGFLPDISSLLARESFQYPTTGFENQIPFYIAEIRVTRSAA